MLSKSSSLRSKQTTTKELIPSITASANTLATQHQHGTQEPRWQILAAFSMNSELRSGEQKMLEFKWLYKMKQKCTHVNQEAYIVSLRMFFLHVSTVKWGFSLHLLNDCCSSGQLELSCWNFNQLLFWKSNNSYLEAHTCKMRREAKQSVIAWNPWSSSLNRMGEKTCWHRLTRPVFSPQRSLFHITHACSCFCVSKNCTWELGIWWFCTQMLLKSHSDIIVPLRKRYWKLILVKVLQECFRGSDGSNVFVKVCCLTYLHSYTNFNAGT